MKTSQKIRMLLLALFAILICASCSGEKEEAIFRPTESGGSEELSGKLSEEPEETKEPAGSENVSSNHGKKASFEQIMSMEKLLRQSDRMIYPDLEENLRELQSRTDYSLIEGKAEKVNYYLTWNREYEAIGGYTTVEILVNQVDSANNLLSLTTGDRICYRYKLHLLFKNNEDLLSWLSDETGTSFDSMEDLKQLENREFLLEPAEGCDYVLYAYDDMMPLKEGEYYSMLVYPVEDSEALGGEFIMATQNEDVSPDRLQKEYGLSFDKDYKNVAKEIAAIFGT